jgi:hypothetical protein
MQKNSKNGSSIFVDNIEIEIHIWHFFCFIKSIFNKIEQGLMNIYKTLYMKIPFDHYYKMTYIIWINK